MTTVRDVMTPGVISVSESTPLKEVARILVERRISGLPVVDAEGRVVGVVSEGDLIAKAQGGEAIQHRRLSGIRGDDEATRAQLDKVDAVTAWGAMTSPAMTIGPDRRVAEAAAAMVRSGVNRLPVVEDGRLVGIVTRADLLRAYVRTDEDLATAVRQEVLLHVLWLDPDRLDVSVSNGVVSIRGQVERRSTVEMLPRLVAAVPGVIDVNSTVSWTWDDSTARPPERDPAFPYGER